MHTEVLQADALLHCIAHFTHTLGAEYVITDNGAKHDYGHDYTEDLHYMPDVVLLPGTAEEVAEILKYCNEHQLPVTARGAGTGLSGGALPVHGGVILSLQRLNKILSVDTRNFQAVVEPGVINEAFQNHVAEMGLFYPPDPASKGSCSLGGNIAHNSGGPRAVKYGVTRNYVLNLEVALPTGELIWTGANTLKNSTGYNLTQLMLGSEGTLGIITKIVFRLLPKPKHDMLLWVDFSSAEAACAAVAKLFHAGLDPSALEFMERCAVEAALGRLNNGFALTEGAEAFLLLEFDGNNPEFITAECERAAMVLEDSGAGEILFADDSEAKERLWKIRRTIGEAVKSISIYKEEDTVVPRAELPILLKGVKEIGVRYGFQSYCYGHAGDGNLHINIIKGDMPDELWHGDINTAIAEIFELCKKLGGTISGEHGIGLVQKPFMPIMFSNSHLDLMRGIKNVFDPKGILNPGKIFD